MATSQDYPPSDNRRKRKSVLCAPVDASPRVGCHGSRRKGAAWNRVSTAAPLEVEQHLTWRSGCSPPVRSRGGASRCMTVHDTPSTQSAVPPAVLGLPEVGVECGFVGH